MPISAPVIETPASIGFRALVIDARLDQIDQAIADHARMHAQIAAIVQQAQDRIGHRADADLKHRAVFDVAGHDLRDRLIGLADLRRRDFDRRARDVNGAVDPRSSAARHRRSVNGTRSFTSAMTTRAFVTAAWTKSLIRPKL